MSDLHEMTVAKSNALIVVLSSDLALMDSAFATYDGTEKTVVQKYALIIVEIRRLRTAKQLLKVYQIKIHLLLDEDATFIKTFANALKDMYEKTAHLNSVKWTALVIDLVGHEFAIAVEITHENFVNTQVVLRTVAEMDFVLIDNVNVIYDSDEKTVLIKYAQIIAISRKIGEFVYEAFVSVMTDINE